MILSQFVHLHLTSVLASQIEHCLTVADFSFLIPPEVAICHVAIEFNFDVHDKDYGPVCFGNPRRLHYQDPDGKLYGRLRWLHDYI